MHQSSEDNPRPRLPARVQAALDFLRYCEDLTQQYDASIPRRELTSHERSVQASALSVLNRYFLGEMDYGDAAPTADDSGHLHDDPDRGRPATSSGSS